MFDFIKPCWLNKRLPFGVLYFALEAHGSLANMIPVLGVLRNSFLPSQEDGSHPLQVPLAQEVGKCCYL